ncbi:putative integral membrane protein [Theileria parva strain Muguga]|uniref:Uncharacterized protein n=1 Tax=Theileria parva TaxID=5875 RepID=Q4MYW4_THEPA|nr:putative integral membrane protein [Theileria parva strain Muguga]EAN30568.1 putative integral membrane protein [Theileria parva strain Muguga]|eukprot:XP_762851.1 hypothetical protein [Theileria parva strain Muguga]
MRVGNKLGQRRQEKLGIDTSYLQQTSELNQKLKSRGSKSLDDDDGLGSVGPSNLQVGSTGIAPGLSHALASAGMGALMGVMGGIGSGGMGMGAMGPMPGMGGMPGLPPLPPAAAMRGMGPMGGMRGMGPMGGMGRPMMR